MHFNFASSPARALPEPQNAYSFDRNTLDGSFHRHHHYFRSIFRIISSWPICTSGLLKVATNDARRWRVMWAISQDACNNDEKKTCLDWAFHATANQLELLFSLETRRFRFAKRILKKKALMTYLNVYLHAKMSKAPLQTTAKPTFDDIFVCSFGEGRIA